MRDVLTTRNGSEHHRELWTKPDTKRPNPQWLLRTNNDREIVLRRVTVEPSYKQWISLLADTKRESSMAPLKSCTLYQTMLSDGWTTQILIFDDPDRKLLLRWHFNFIYSLLFIFYHYIVVCLCIIFAFALRSNENKIKW